MNNSDLLPPPQAFGLPEKFQTWREDQIEAITDFLEDEGHRFPLDIMPTGAGKTLVYVAIATITGRRTCILTSTKGLQKQLRRDFEELGIVVVMGKNAYQCRYIPTVACDLGPCNFGVRCSYKDAGCPYYDKIREGARSDLVVTNYAFWHSNDPENPAVKYKLGHFDLLVCDEAHNSANHLLDALSIELTPKRLERLGISEISWPKANLPDGDYWDWIKAVCKLVDRELEIIRANPSYLSQVIETKEFRAMCKFSTEIGNRVGGADYKKWVVEHTGPTITFDPIWPGDFSEILLFRGVEKILMISATVNKKVMSFLDIDQDELKVKEYPSRFPVERRPIYMINSFPKLRVDFRMSNADYSRWISLQDNIIGRRLDRNGITHTVSYDRAQRILNASSYSDCFLTHDRNSKSANGAVEIFKLSDPPTVLVSPSMVTGWDFPYTQCEYQILSKVPFPDMRKKVDKRRKEIDPDYGMCYAMLNLVQACGRGMRAEDDQCECFIIDDHFKWFIKKYKEFAPGWFRQAIKYKDLLPEPLPKL